MHVAELIIGADLAPSSNNLKEFINGNVEKIIDEDCIKVLKSADYRIFNLESPLIDSGNPLKKSGPHFGTPKEAISSIVKMNIDLFTLGNNHILDQGYEGLISTIDTLKKAKIAYVGVGKNIEEAKKPYLVTINGIKIGVYACAEHEFSIAGNTTPGANPFDPLFSLDDINMLKEKCEFVIVLFHGGTELYRYPTPRLQKICKRMVDKGADLVLVQHTHCIGAIEEYKNGTIIYGQGNFILDYNINDINNSGILVKLKITRTESDISYNCRYIPIIHESERVRLASGENREKIITDLIKRSNNIKKYNFIEDEYKKYVNLKIYEYMKILGGRITNNKIVNQLPERIGKCLVDTIYSEADLLMLKDLFMCESNAELMIEGLSDT